MTLVGYSFSSGPTEMHSWSKCVSISAGSSLCHVCEVHLALAGAGTVARTSLFSTHHYHRVKVISPVNKVPTTILLRIVRRLVSAPLNTIHGVIM